MAASGAPLDPHRPAAVRRRRFARVRRVAAGACEHLCADPASGPPRRPFRPGTWSRNHCHASCNRSVEDALQVADFAPVRLPYQGDAGASSSLWLAAVPSGTPERSRLGLACSGGSSRPITEKSMARCSGPGGWRSNRDRRISS
jgi:hypothetical protein